MVLTNPERSETIELLGAVGVASFDVYQCVESVRVNREFDNKNGVAWQTKVAKKLIGRLKKAISEYEGTIKYWQDEKDDH